MCFVRMRSSAAHYCRIESNQKVTTVQTIKSVGSTGFALLGKGNSKELELEAADAATRDLWVSVVTARGQVDGPAGKGSQADWR